MASNLSQTPTTFQSMQRSEQLPEKMRTSQAVRASLNSVNKDLKNARVMYRGVHEDEVKANKAIAKLEEKKAYFRKNQLEHQARGLETGQLLKKHQTLRDAERLSKELPGRIQALEKKAEKLNQELATALSAEQAKKDASRTKNGSTITQPGSKQQPARVRNRRLVRIKTGAAKDSHFCDAPTASPPPSTKQKATNLRRGVQASSRKDSHSTDDALKPKTSGVSKPEPPKKPTTFRRRQQAKKEAIKATALQLHKEAKAAQAAQQSSSKSQQDGVAGNNSKATKVSAPPKNKKRSAPVDEDPVDKSAKRQKLDDQPRPRGLINHTNACFSNAVIQLLDKALEGHNLDTMIGKAGNVETFGLTEQDLKEFDNVKTIGMKSKGLEQKQTELRSAIKAAALAGEVEKLSAGKHLRKVIDDLHAPQEGPRDAAVSPYMLQQVVAWGAEEDVDRDEGSLSSRQELSGDTQEDSFQYFRRLVLDLANDTNAADPSKVKNLFEVETETTRTCPDGRCTYSKDLPKAWNPYHNVNVPDAKTLKAATGAASAPSMSSLISDSLEAITDAWCEGSKCGEKLNENKEITKVPDTFVVNLNRASFRNNAVKVSTKVKLDNVLELQDSRYVLEAVVMHKGPRLNRGHYTAYRKHHGTWYCLDDSMCTAEAPEDGAKRGNAVMALYKKVEV